METGGGLVAAGAWEEGEEGESLLPGHKVSFWGDDMFWN